MDVLAFLLPPVLGGLIALSTNWLAIRMLFRPHREKRLFGFKLPFTPGLIPKERERITKKLAEAISTRLLTPEVLEQELSDSKLWQLPDITIGEALQKFDLSDTAKLVEASGSKIKQAAEALLPKAIEAIQDMQEKYPALDKKLEELTAKVIEENAGRFMSMFVSKEKVYTSLRNGLLEYLADEENRDIIKEKLFDAIDSALANETVQKALTEKILSFNLKHGLGTMYTHEQHTVNRVLGVIAAYLAANMPIQAMIENKMAQFEVEEAEEIILSVAGRELRAIVLLGGVLGFFIGLLAVLL